MKHIFIILAVVISFGLKAQDFVGSHTRVIHTGPHKTYTLQYITYTSNLSAAPDSTKKLYFDPDQYIDAHLSKDSILNNNLRMLVYEKTNFNTLGSIGFYTIDSLPSHLFDNLDNSHEFSPIPTVMSYSVMGPFWDNSTPICDYPINISTTGGVVSFQMNCFDIDLSTSIKYGLHPLGGILDTTFTYYMPTASNSIGMGYSSGIFTWDKPTQVGHYLFRVIIFEANVQGGSSSDFLFTITIDQNILSALNETKQENITFSAFPNPTTDRLNVRLSLEEVRDCQLTLRNVVGQMVLQKQLGKIEQIEEVLEVGHLPSGIYFLSVSDGVQNVTRKVVVR